ncbi:hypothetical protein ACFRMQ_22230 [Kitasatospora sp. NPDC056783]|uniref:hypothetical protein n=1 Tax=Kitasatospora sp. NPDC056783 TaxID=3345943 RepID=UPI0036BDB5E8
MDPSTPWRNLGVIGLRLADLVIRYTVTSAVTWILTMSMTAQTGGPVPADVLRFMAITGIPSIAICVVYSLFREKTGTEFRGPLAGLLILPLWLLFLFPPLLIVPLLGQAFFALCVVRAPLLGPSRLRPLVDRLRARAAA